MGQGRKARLLGALVVTAVAGALSFAAVAEATSPTVTVTPNTGLADSQQVSVSGVGYGSSETVEFDQCNSALTLCKPLAHPMSSPSGVVSPIAVTVNSNFASEPPFPAGAVDCRAAGCVVRATGAVSANTDTEPISFAPLPTLPAATPTAVATAQKKCKKGRKLKRGRCVRKKKKK